MTEKIKELHELKYKVCVSVSDIMEVNMIINSYNEIIELKRSIEAIIDKKILELKVKERINYESKC